MRILRYLLTLLWTALFFVFTYNSGYGYDAVEYFVIGHSLLDGYSVFAFSPSKSPGIYYLVAGFLHCFPEAGHVEITFLITGIVLLILIVVYRIVRTSHGTTAALISSGFLALSACFMEMNFLETEGFVFLLALPSLACLRNGMRRESSVWLAVAGLWIGAAAFFKSVALFYLLGATVFICAWARHRMAAPWPRITRWIIALWGGAMAAQLIPTAYYLIRGEIHAYLFWSYIFPAIYYPTDTIYLPKLFTKLGWFWAATGGSLLLTLHPRVRAACNMSVYPTAALSLGLAALLPLFKNQASHYVFPAAGFLAIFVGMVWAAFAEIHPRGKRILSVVISLGGLLAGASILLYRPTVIRRLVTLRDYRHENSVACQLRALVPNGHLMLCMSHPLPYWLARRYPAIPSVATHVQFSYYFKKNPNLLLDALDHPRLALVEFDPSWTMFRAPTLKSDATALAQLNSFSAKLARDFYRLEIRDAPFVFWRRR